MAPVRAISRDEDRKENPMDCGKAQRLRRFFHHTRTVIVPMDHPMFGRPNQWREIFKPWYWDEFRLAHESGLDVLLHSCGDVWDIIPNLRVSSSRRPTVERIT